MYCNNAQFTLDVRDVSVLILTRIYMRKCLVVFTSSCAVHCGELYFCLNQHNSLLLSVVRLSRWKFIFTVKFLRVVEIFALSDGDVVQI